MQEVEKDVSNYCQVCTKHFSTNNAYESHMRSKRHRDTMVKQAQSKTKNERNRRRKKGGEEDAGTVTGGGGDGDAKMEAVSGKEEEDIEEGGLFVIC